jgi:hypothetical protein
MNVETEAAATHPEGAVILDRWIARKTRPVVVFYVALVFAAFGMVAFFALHSPAAVKALLLAAVGAIAATVATMAEKVEYRLTDLGIDKRPNNPDKPKPFNEVFRWDQLDRVVPMKHGFKYVTTIPGGNSLRRFWNLHISDRFSGEVHVEKRDRDRILRIVEQRVSRNPTKE